MLQTRYVYKICTSFENMLTLKTGFFTSKLLQTLIFWQALYLLSYARTHTHTTHTHHTHTHTHTQFHFPVFIQDVDFNRTQELVDLHNVWFDIGSERIEGFVACIDFTFTSRLLILLCLLLLLLLLSDTTTCPCGLRGPPSWEWQECNRLLRLGRPWGAVTLSRWCEWWYSRM